MEIGERCRDRQINYKDQRETRASNNREPSLKGRKPQSRKASKDEGARSHKQEVVKGGRRDTLGEDGTLDGPDSAVYTAVSKLNS